MYAIYVLIDPRDDKAYYVGMTTNPEIRLTGHLSDDPDSNRLKHTWIKNLAQVGLKPRLEIIETWAEQEQAEEREVYWIAFYRSMNMPLLNRVTRKTRSPRKSGKSGRSHRTQAEIEALLEDYRRTGIRPKVWTRQTFYGIRKKRGLI